MSESDEREGAEVLKSLPARRPQRRSARRGGAKPAARKPAPRKKAAATAKQSATAARKPAAGHRPAGVRPSEATRAASSTPGQRPAQSPEGIELVGTAIQAAGELAQIGLTVGGQVLKRAVKRLPKR
jgi:hypothetical protein